MYHSLLTKQVALKHQSQTQASPQLACDLGQALYAQGASGKTNRKMMTALWVSHRGVSEEGAASEQTLTTVKQDAKTRSRKPSVWAMLSSYFVIVQASTLLCFFGN